MKKNKKKNIIIHFVIIFIILCGTIWIVIENQNETIIEEDKDDGG